MNSADSKASVLIVGSGGVGTMAAYALETGGKATVTSVLRSNFAIVEKEGYHITSLDHGEVKGWRPSAIRNTIPNVEEEKLPPFDFILVTTKNIPDVAPAVHEIVAPAITPGHTAVMLLQNGFNIERPFVEAFPGNPVLSGISLIAATEVPLGRILHEDRDRIVAGAFRNPHIPHEVADAAARRFIAAYGACPRVECTYDPDVKYWRWRKLLYNASFNSVSTVLQMDTTRMRVSEFVIDDLIRPVMQEIIAAARADGVTLTETMAEDVIVCDPYEAWFKPSMQQDGEKGNFIEFENIIGEPLREAEKLGVPTPYLKVLYSLLKGLQWKTKEAKGIINLPPKSAPDMKYGDK